MKDKPDQQKNPAQKQKSKKSQPAGEKDEDFEWTPQEQQGDNFYVNKSGYSVWKGKK